MERRQQSQKNEAKLKDNKKVSTKNDYFNEDKIERSSCHVINNGGGLFPEET